jgi:hypothetical protein
LRAVLRLDRRSLTSGPYTGATWQLEGRRNGAEGGAIVYLAAVARSYHSSIHTKKRASVGAPVVESVVRIRTLRRRTAD